MAAIAGHGKILGPVVLPGAGVGARVEPGEIYIDYRSDHTRPDGSLCWTAYKDYGVAYDASAEWRRGLNP